MHGAPPAPDSPQRSIAQIVFPSGLAHTPAVDPHFLPSCNFPQCTPGRNGLGRSLRAPSSDIAGSLTGDSSGENGAALSPLGPFGPATRGGRQVSAYGPGEPPVPLLIMFTCAVGP